MTEQRKNTRYHTLARVEIEGVNEGEALLKDISVTGCCVECTAYAEAKLNIQYKLRIIPESSAKIGMFDLLVESRWIHSGSYSCEIGFFIMESPKGKAFQRYVDYLSWRYSHGNSMTGGHLGGIPSEGSTTLA